jgi:hypothetical protein
MQPPDAAAFAERLNQVLDGVKGVPARGKRGDWLGKWAGVSKASGGDWLRGKNMPEPWRVLHMADRWKVSFMWLYFGRKVTEADSQQNTNEESVKSSPNVRLDTLTVALEVAAEALESERPTPAQHSRLSAILYALIEDGMARAEVLQFARRAAVLVSGGNGGSTEHGDGA